MLRRWFLLPLIFFLVGCLPTFQGTGPKLGWLGDSITVQSADEIRTAITPYHSISIQAWGGLTIGDQQKWAPQYAAVPDLHDMVIELGTNNAMLDTPHEAEIDAMLTALSSVPCVWWVTVESHTPNPDLNVRAAAINQYLATATATHPNLTLIDWDTHSAYQPWFSDNVHLNQLGQDNLAAFVTAAIQPGCN